MSGVCQTCGHYVCRCPTGDQPAPETVVDALQESGQVSELDVCAEACERGFATAWEILETFVPEKANARLIYELAFKDGWIAHVDKTCDELLARCRK